MRPRKGAEFDFISTSTLLALVSWSRFFVQALHEPFDLLCVCGKGGTCLDRTVDAFKLPRGLSECECDISTGYYDKCDTLVNHCTSAMCLNGGTCVPTFGGFYCACPPSYYGMVCESFSSSSENVEAPMTFSWIHDPINESKPLLLAVKQLGSNFEATVDFHDGRYRVLKVKDFTRLGDMNRACLSDYDAFPRVHDKRVCEFLFNAWNTPMYVAVIFPAYPLRMYRDTDHGRVDSMTITFKNGDTVNFQQNRSFYTPFYGHHDYVNDEPCQYQIAFHGCGMYFNTIRRYRVSEWFEVSVVKKPIRHCKPIAQRFGRWRYYPNSSNAFIEEDDEGMTLGKIFPSFLFKTGRRWIEYHYKEIGDENRYGVSNEYVSRGKCSVFIEKGYGSLHIIGGTNRTFPCYQALELEVSTSDPSLDINSFIVEWKCDQNLTICEAQESYGSQIIFDDLPCGLEFNFTARIKSDDFHNAVAYQIIEVIENIPEFYITCLHNCNDYYQPSEYIRLSFVVSVILDDAPQWSIAVDGIQVSAANRTDGRSIFLPGPHEYLDSSGPKVLTISATIGSMKSEMLLQRVELHYNGPCQTIPSVINQYDEFDVRCFNEGDDILSLRLIESPQDWELMGEVVSETSEMTLFDVEINSDDVQLFAYSSQWFLPVDLPSTSFKPPTVKSIPLDTDEVLSFLEKWDEEVDSLISSCNYFDALGKFSQMYYLLTISFRNESFRPIYLHIEGIYRYQTIKKLGKISQPTTFMSIFKMLFIMYRIGKLDLPFVWVKSQRHVIMRYLSIMLGNVVSNYGHLLNTAKNLLWLQQTKPNFVRAVFDLASNLFVMPYSEFKFREYLIDDDFPQYLFETKYGGGMLLGLLDAMRSKIFLSPVYAEPLIFESDFYFSWFQTDTLVEIHKRITEIKQFYVLSTGSDEYSDKIYYYSFFTLQPEAFWWVGEDVGAHEILSRIVSGTHVNFKTKEITNFPRNLIHFLLDPISLWDSSELMEGRVENAPYYLTEEEKDRSLIIWQLAVPVPSTGLLLFNMLLRPNKIKLYARLGQFPSYLDVFNSPTYEGSENEHDFAASLPFSVSSTDNSNKIYVAALPYDNSSKSSTNYIFTNVALICLSYSRDQWDRYECNIQNMKYRNVTEAVCECSRISWHAVEKINFGARKVIADSPYPELVVPGTFYVFGNLLVVCVFLGGLFVWAWWMEQKKFDANALHLLESPQVYFKFLYLVAVHTGNQIGSGTDSSVGFRLIGRHSRCGPHLFRYRTTRKRLSTGRVDWFLIESQIHLGDLKSVDIWSDFSGSLVNWYCERIIVYDLVRLEAHHFLIRRWLIQTDGLGYVCNSKEIDSDDDDIETRSDEVATAKQSDFVELCHYVVNQIGESHRWFSFFHKSRRNIYSCKHHAVMLGSFISSVMSFAMLFKSLSGEWLDTEEVFFTQYDAILSISVLIVSYVVYALQIVLLEKSYELLKVMKPVGAKNFRKAHSSYAYSRSDKRTKLNDFLRKYLSLHLIAPSNYYPWLDIVGSQKASRTKIFSWFLAWIIFSVFVCVLSLTYVLTCGFQVKRGQSLQWMVIYGVALLADAFIFNPLILTMKSIFLFYCERRRIWDNFYIVGVCDTQVKELDRSNYFKEYRQEHAMKKSYYAKILKIDRFTKTLLSWDWLVVALSLTLFLAFFTMRIDVHTRNELVKIRGLETIFHESQSGRFNFTNVRNASELVDFLNLQFLPSLHRFHWYNGRTLPTPAAEPFPDDDDEDYWSPEERRIGWVADYSNKLIGIPIFRQLRVNSLPPDTAFSKFLKPTGGVLDYWSIETRNFSKNWTEYEDIGQMKGTWTYSEDYGVESALWNMIRRTIYGYVYEYPSMLGPSKRNTTSLFLYNWFDGKTRYLSLHFVLFAAPTLSYTCSELRVTVSPESCYRATFAFDAITFSPMRTHVIGLTPALVIGLIGSLRIFIIIRVRGYANYSHKSNFTIDFLLVVACILLIIFCLLQILRDAFVDLYVDRSHRTDFLRLFELLTVDGVSFAVAGGFVFALLVICTNKFLLYTRSEIIHDGTFKGVVSNALLLLLFFTYFNENIHGLLLVLLLDKEINLAPRAYLRDLSSESGDNSHLILWMIICFIVVRLFILSNMTVVYQRLAADKASMLAFFDSDQRKKPLISITKTVRDLVKSPQRSVGSEITRAPRKWTWFGQDSRN